MSADRAAGAPRRPGRVIQPCTAEVNGHSRKTVRWRDRGPAGVVLGHFRSGPRRVSLARRGSLHRLTLPPGREDRLTHLEVLPGARRARAPLAGVGRPGPGRRPGRARGVDRAVAPPGRGRRGGAPAASTSCSRPGTASGKSLGYLLPALTAVPGARGRPGRRGATTLYLSPTKALAQDQLGLAARARAARAGGDHPRRRLAPASSGTGPATTRSTS